MTTPQEVQIPLAPSEKEGGKLVFKPIGEADIRFELPQKLGANRYRILDFLEGMGIELLSGYNDCAPYLIIMKQSQYVRWNTWLDKNRIVIEDG